MSATTDDEEAELRGSPTNGVGANAGSEAGRDSVTFGRLESAKSSDEKGGGPIEELADASGDCGGGAV